MKVLKFLWQKLLLPTFAVYTLLSTVTLFFLTVITKDTQKPALTLSSSVMLLFLSLFVCGATLIFYLPKLRLCFKLPLNFFATLFSIIIIISFGSYEMDANSLVLILVFTFVYIIVAIPVLVIKSIIDKKSKEEKSYTSMFKGK